jgi:hypothetical protein
VGALFPIRSSGNLRYPVDSNGNPFLINGESAWLLFQSATSSEADTYIADRAGRGFNAVLLQLFGHYDHIPNSPNTMANVAPFTTAGNLSTVNSSYLDYCYDVAGRLVSNGIMPFIAGLYVGHDETTEGWDDDMIASTDSIVRGLGKSVGNRFKDLPVVWINAGDQLPTGTLLSRCRAFADGVLETHRGGWHTAHNGRTNPGHAAFGSDGWFKLNDAYTQEEDQISLSWDCWNRSPTLPFFDIEDRYVDSPFVSMSRQALRAQAYWSKLAGCAGRFFGDEHIWLFRGSSIGSTEWQNRLNSVYVQDVTRWYEFFKPIAWHELVPDQDSSVLTSGRGTLDTSTQAACARAANGNLIVSYFPTSRSYVIDATKMSGTFRGRYFDPQAGTYSDVAGGPRFPNTGTLSKTSPAGDSVLILQALDA